MRHCSVVAMTNKNLHFAAKHCLPSGILSAIIKEILWIIYRNYPDSENNLCDEFGGIPA